MSRNLSKQAIFSFEAALGDLGFFFLFSSAFGHVIEMLEQLTQVKLR